MGGSSSERDISLTSGRAAAAALGELGHKVTSIDVRPDVAARLTECAPDAVFIALHGRGGEDGHIQGLLATMGLPYTGSGVLASAACCDKVITKRLLTQAGIPTPLLFSAPGNGPLPTTAYPVVVKPNHGGSSIGIHMVDTPAALGTALSAALAEEAEVLVEAAIIGREITVSVLDGEALPVLEIIPRNGFFSFEAKYQKDSGTDYQVPANLPDSVSKQAQNIAVKSYNTLKCAGAARVDLMLDAELNPWVLEINTIPGMTLTSLLPKAAAAVGIPFNKLMGRILDLAVVPTP
jgi:D-alanine-D-alanine ligase